MKTNDLLFDKLNKLSSQLSGEINFKLETQLHMFLDYSINNGIIIELEIDLDIALHEEFFVT